MDRQSWPPRVAQSHRACTQCRRGNDDNGTNPAKNTTTFIASNEYYTLDGHNRINTTYARLKFPIYDSRGAMLPEIPFVHYDFRGTNPNLPQIGGIGDIKFQLSYNTWSSADKRLTMINFNKASRARPPVAG